MRQAWNPMGLAGRPRSSGRTSNMLRAFLANFSLVCALHASHEAAAQPAIPVASSDLSAVVRAALATVEPSIVIIETIGGAQPIRQDARRGPMEESFRLAEGPTTGVILTADGHILSSSFNFARDPSVITVVLHDGRRLVAKLIARDHIRRLALIKVDARDLPVPDWTPREQLHIGQYAIACGKGMTGSTRGAGTRQTFVSVGIVSALNRRNGNAVQTDAKISPANYGGPLIDLDGRVIGILVPMAGSGGALAGAEWYDGGIGFAIYKDRIDAVHERLAAGQNIEPGKIGVMLEPDDVDDALSFLDKLLPQSRGVKIARIAKPSPAQRAELKDGDKIIALDGKPTGDLAELQRRLSDRAAGETVVLTIKRRFQRIDVPVELARIEDIGSLDAPPQPTPMSDDESDAPSSQPSAD